MVPSYGGSSERGRLLPGRLRAVHPADLRWEISLGTKPVTIGSLDGPARLDGTGVAPRHVRVRYEPAHVRHVASDLGSPPGTRIDGRRSSASTVPLRDGDVVRLGDVCLVYEGPYGDDDQSSLSSTSTEAVPGRAPTIEALRAQLEQAARHDAPVLLEGEPGTGKRRIARVLHRMSERPGSLVVIDCATLMPGQLEAVIARERSGTILLEEIGDLQPVLQRDLAEIARQVHGVRIVATTRRPSRPTLEGHLRRDLLTAMSRSHLRVPPLRNRRGDIMDWLRRIATTPLPELSATAAEAILLAAWPDNLHGLRRLRDQISGLRRMVRPSDLPAWAGLRDVAPTTAIPSSEDFVTMFEQLEGNVSALARHFARNRRQIYRWIEKHGLAKPPDPE
jgi:DNA-binding NtrC family response regulator